MESEDRVEDVEVKADAPQVNEKVKVKRNRGIKRDIKQLIEVNPVLSVKEVFELVKNNVYGGSKPVTQETVAVTMSLLKPKSL